MVMFPDAKRTSKKGKGGERDDERSQIVVHRPRGGDDRPVAGDRAGAGTVQGAARPERYREGPRRIAVSGDHRQ